MSPVSQHLSPLEANALSAFWFYLHAAERFGICSNELHYLHALALALDDDLTSLLLLKKLKLADQFSATSIPRDVAALNSFVEFRAAGGPSQLCQLTHRSAHQGAGAYALCVDTRLGAGLLGLRAGQSILWPDEEGLLQELHLLRADNRPGIEVLFTRAWPDAEFRS
jgi:regulator of nucleoside diphosphate kinase